MRFELPYGRASLPFDIPDGMATVIEPPFTPALPDADGALRSAIRNPIGAVPLRQTVSAGSRVAVAVSGEADTAAANVLAAVLNELSRIRELHVTVIGVPESSRPSAGSRMTDALKAVASPSHRMLIAGPDAVESRNETAKAWAEADIRIAIPRYSIHPLFGISGALDLVAAIRHGGLDALIESFMDDDSGQLPAWGATEGNPLHEAVLAQAGEHSPQFSVGYAVNGTGRLTAVYAGEMLAVHRAMSPVARRNGIVTAENQYDMVLTSGGGYPRDEFLEDVLLQIVSAACIIKPGGAILCAAACEGGTGDVGVAGWKRTLLQKSQAVAEVCLLSGLPDNIVRSIGIVPSSSSRDLQAAASNAIESGKRVCVLSPGVVPSLRA